MTDSIPVRATRIAAIRKLADVLEQCPDLPCPEDAFISLRDGTDDTSIEQLQAAEQQLTACGFRVRRESPSSSRRQYWVGFDLDGFTYDAFRVYTDPRAATTEEAAA